MSGHPTLRRKLRRDIRRTLPLFLALVVTILLGISLYAASNNAYINLTTSYDNAFTVQRFPDLFVTTPTPDGYTSSISGDGTVKATRSRVQADLPMSITNGSGDPTKLTGRIVGYPASGEPAVAALTSISGRPNPSAGHALAEQHLADTFDLKAGDTVTLTTAVGDQTVTIDGIASSAEYFWPAPSRQVEFVPADSFGVLFVSEDDAASWSGAGPNQALVLLTDAARESSNAPSTLDALTQTAVDGGASQVLTRATQPSNSVLQEDITGFQQMATAFPVLFLSAAGLAMYVLLTRRVTQERQVIGTLRALGVRGRTIAWHYLSYGLIAAIIGTALGLPLGMAMAGALSHAYLGFISVPASLAVYRIFSLETVLVGIAFAVVATLISAGFPARRAGRTPPAEAMRGDVPAGHGRSSHIEHLVPGLQHMPTTWRMIVRSISRNGRRTVFTGTGVVLALVLILASVGLMDSMANLITVQFQRVTLSDATVQYATPVGDQQLTDVRAVDGVNAAESVISQQVSIRHGSEVYSTTFTAYDPHTTMHGFITKSGDDVPLPSDGIILDEAITSQIPSLQRGDKVTLTFPNLNSVSVETTVKDFAYEPMGTFAYSTKAWLRAAVPQAVATTVEARFTEGADPATVRASMSALPGVMAYMATSSLESTMSQYSGLFYVFVGAMLILGGAMAFAIIFTTMSVNIVERQREFATMRAAGVRFRKIAGLVRGENLLVVILGIVPGLLLGIWVSYEMLQVYSNDQFTMDLYVNPMTLVWSAVAVVAVAFLSQWPGMRAMRRMNVADVVRERS